MLKFVQFRYTPRFCVMTLGVAVALLSDLPYTGEPPGHVLAKLQRASATWQWRVRAGQPVLCVGCKNGTSSFISQVS